MKETIQNPDLWLTPRCWENCTPYFSHYEVEIGEPLQSSENPVVEKLLALGFEIREAVMSLFAGFPTREYQLARYFKAKEATELQIHFDGGFLRFRFEQRDTVYLSLFKIDRERRSKGLARHHFPRVLDGLFRAGITSVRGKVSRPNCEPEGQLNFGKILRFYVQEAGFTHEGGGVVSKRSPYLTAPVQSSP